MSAPRCCNKSAVELKESFSSLSVACQNEVALFVVVCFAFLFFPWKHFHQLTRNQRSSSAPFVTSALSESGTVIGTWRRHSTKASFSCVFSECDLVFDTADSLGSHQEKEHGLDTSSAQKRAKVGVVHDDHYDLMLQSGMLLHMGEHGVEERLLGQDGAVVTDG